MSDIIIYYDGECPYCKSYQKVIDIKKKYSFELKDARLHPLEISNLKDQGYKIEDGILMIFKDEIFQGAQALRRIDLLIEKKTTISKLYALIIRLPFFANIMYPIVKIIRIVTLKIMGIKRMK
jgi:predicted DCC family thiol-disulfide oxidoreductase YuxK